MSEENSGFKPRPRIQTLSDLIFGLALSIGALTMISQQPTNFQSVVASLLFYSFSFLVLVSVWRSYRITNKPQYSAPFHRLYRTLSLQPTLHHQRRLLEQHFSSVRSRFGSDVSDFSVL